MMNCKSIVKACTVALILIFTAVFTADAQRGSIIRMKLVDSLSGVPVEFATVSLHPKGADKVSQYVLSDKDGNVTLTSVAYGEYLLKCELMGYKVWSRDLKVVEPEYRLGEVKMQEDVNLLEAARVTAVANPIVVKKDTLEYSATSYKSSDNDMLEDLLKKMPGFEVGEDGKITWNGESVPKIMIEGRTFFLDDPQLASKNIPANIINKIRVVEKKSEQAEFTGISDGNEETVIDISVKKGMLGGWFGNIQAGGGVDLLRDKNNPDAPYDPRWQGGAMIGNFSDKHQISILVGGNNTNNKGFDDLAGGMMTTMRGSRGMGRGSGGFGRGNGITTSWMAGANGNFTLFDDKMELDANYMYNGSDNNVEEDVSKTTFKQDGTSLLYKEKGISSTLTQGHRFGFEVDHKFSENTSIFFRPQFNFGSGRFKEQAEYTTDTDLSALTGNTGDVLSSNYGDSYTDGSSRSWKTNGYFLFRQRLGKPGRTMSLSVNYNFSGNTLSGVNRSNTTTESYDADYNHTGTSTETIDQIYDQYEYTNRIGGRFSYTEPLYKERLFMEATYSYDWSRSNSVNNTYNKLEDGSYEQEPDPVYSSLLKNEYVNQRAGLNLQWQKKGSVISLGATAQPNHTMNTTVSQGVETNTDYKVVNWAPTARIDYRPDDQTFFRLFYMGYSSQPTSVQLQPSLNVSNPLLLTLGNNALDPTFNHMLRGHFRHTDKKTFFTVNAMISGNYTANSIINATWYDPSGVQYSIPVNSKGTFQANARLMLNAPIAKSGFTISSFTSLRYTGSTSFVGDWDYAIDTDNFVYNDFIEDFRAAFNDGSSFVENTTTGLGVSQMLRLMYRNDKIEVSLGGEARYNQAWYSINKEQNTTTWNNTVNASVNYTLPWGLTIATDARYNFYFGYDDGFNEPQLIWNAHIDKLLFKKKFTLSLIAYDMLNQSRNVYRTTTDNYVQDTRNNTLGRYLILSLTYRFGSNRGGRPGPPPPHMR